MTSCHIRTLFITKLLILNEVKIITPEIQLKMYVFMSGYLWTTLYRLDRTPYIEAKHTETGISNYT